jgi:anti-anti-sigma regulatory factor
VQVTARGALDAASVSVLRDAAGRVDLSPGRVVLLDLSGATVVDAAVVRFATGLHARVAAHGSSLVVVAQPHVREQFAAAGAEEVRIVEDGESAA